MLSSSHSISRIQSLGSNSVDLDEAAHYDLCCLKIRLLNLSVVAVKHFPVHNHSAYDIFSGPLGPLDSV